jgi:hypothetical protein
VVSPVKGCKFSNTTVSYNLHVHIGLFCLTERVIAMSFPSTGIRALRNISLSGPHDPSQDWLAQLSLVKSMDDYEHQLIANSILPVAR